MFESRKVESELTKSDLIAAAKELNVTLDLQPQINVYQNKNELIAGIKECEELLHHNDDITRPTLDVMESLDIEFPECPPEEDTTIYDSAEVILEFMPQINERIGTIEAILYEMLHPGYQTVGIGRFDVRHNITEELKSMVHKNEPETDDDEPETDDDESGQEASRPNRRKRRE